MSEKHFDWIDSEILSHELANEEAGDGVALEVQKALSEEDIRTELLSILEINSEDLVLKDKKDGALEYQCLDTELEYMFGKHGYVYHDSKLYRAGIRHESVPKILGVSQLEDEDGILLFEEMATYNNGEWEVVQNAMIPYDDRTEGGRRAAISA